MLDGLHQRRRANRCECCVGIFQRSPHYIRDRSVLRKPFSQGRRRKSFPVLGVTVRNYHNYLRIRHAKFLVGYHSVGKEAKAHQLVEWVEEQLIDWYLVALERG